MRGNTVSIAGNLTRDGEVKELANGSVALNLGLAWNGSRKNAQTGQWEDVPNYFSVKCYMTARQWGAVQQRNSFAKGARCMVVDGRLSWREWQDKEGNRRSAVEIVVDDPMNGLCAVPRADAPQHGDDGRGCYGQGAIYDEDIPF